MDGRQRLAAGTADPANLPAPADLPAPANRTGHWKRAARWNRAGRAGSRADGTPWSHTDALVAVGAGLLDLVAYLLFSQVEGTRSISVPGFLVLLLSGLPLLARRHRPVRALTAVLALETLANVLAPMGTHFGAVLTVAVYSVARHCSGRVTAAAGVATAVATMLSQSGIGAPSWGRPSPPPPPPRWWPPAASRSRAGSARSRPTANCWPIARWPRNAAASPGSCTTSWPTTSPPCS